MRTCNTDTMVLKYQYDQHQDSQGSFHCQLTKQQDYENYSALTRNDDDRHCPLKNQRLQYLLNPKVYLTFAENRPWTLLPKGTDTIYFNIIIRLKK